MPRPARAIRVVEVLEATIGGTRKHLRFLMDALVGREFDVRLVCATRREPSFVEDLERFRSLGVRVTVLPMVRSPAPLSDLACARALRRALRSEPCDVLHLHSSKAGWIGRLAAWGLPCKVVYTPHSFAFEQRGSPVLSLLASAAERAVARRTDLLLAVGPAEARTALGQGLVPAARARVLQNAVDPDELEAEARRGSPSPTRPPGPLIGFLGDLRTQKDPLTFVAAARRLADEVEDVQFVLPERGLLLADVRRAVWTLGLAGRVHLVPQEDRLLSYLGRLDVGVQCSRWEGQPYAILEALALRVPVVGSDIPAIAGLLDEAGGGLVFPAGDARALAQRLAHVLRLPADERERIGTRGRELVEREHAIGPWGEALRDVYRSLA